MEKNSKEIDLSELRLGTIIECQACHKGVYKPRNTTPDKDHYFECDKCGDIVHFDPVIDEDFYK